MPKIRYINKFVLLVCLNVLTVRLNGVQIASFELLRDGESVNYVDASNGVPQQVISAEFFLEAEESYSRTEFVLEGNIVVTIDSDGETSYMEPFSETNSLISSNYLNMTTVELLEPSLLFRGEYTVTVITDTGSQDEEMNMFYGFKKCESGWRFDQTLDSSGCSITFSGGCSENGTIFPEPYLANVGLYSEIIESYLDHTSPDTMDSPPLGTFVKGSTMPDGSFTYQFESEVNFEVNSMTPKELSLKAEVLHGAESIREGELIEADDSRVLDKFVDQGQYGIFNSVGCMDWTEFCNDPDSHVQPYLPGNVKLDPNIRCKMEDPVFYQLREHTCRTDLLPLDPVDKDDDGEFEDPKDVLLVLYCDLRCDIVWPVSGFPINKTLECEPDSNTWDEYDLSGIYESMRGYWPVCDCTYRDSFVETDGGAADLILSLTTITVTTIGVILLFL